MPELSQPEFKSYLDQGKDHIWAYKNLFAITKEKDLTYYLKKR